MIAKRVIVVLTFFEGVLYRTKKFKPDYRYTDNFIDNKLVDEIVIIDVSDTKKNRVLFYNSVKKISKSCFVPITVGGHINDIDEISILQNCGADKILINSLIHKNKEMVKKITSKYGSQFVIGGIDFLLQDKIYKLFTDHSKKELNISIEKCLKRFEECKIGEILAQSIDRDGSLRGYDNDIIKEIKENTNLPVIVCGGAGNWDHFIEAFNISNVDGVCTNNIYHYSEKSITLIKKTLDRRGIYVRIE
jgi:imidazole glycerol-phosphate synthase subunit HisF